MKEHIFDLNKVIEECYECLRQRRERIRQVLGLGEEEIKIAEQLKEVESVGRYVEAE